MRKRKNGLCNKCGEKKEVLEMFSRDVKKFSWYCMDCIMNSNTIIPVSFNAGIEVGDIIYPNGKIVRSRRIIVKGHNK